jgi:CHAT domain-containing protein/tetratricopeptide (TPR) repeat protein
MTLKAKCVSLFLLLFSVNCFGQSTTAPTPTSEDDLVRGLLSVRTGDERAAQALLKDHKNVVTRRVCDSLLQAASLASSVGNQSRSLFICEVAREAASQLDDKKLLAFVIYRIARVHFQDDAINTAIQEYLESKRVFEEAGAPRDLIYILAELGTACIFAADYQKAEEYSRESLTLAGTLEDSKVPAAALPDEYGTAFAWSNLGHVARWKGDHDEALVDFQRSLGLWKELRTRGYWSAGNIADALLDIAHVYQATGNHLRALKYLSEAMDVSRTLLDRSRKAAVLNDLGVLYLEQADYAKAAQFINESLAIFEQLHNKREIARNLSNLGVICFRERKYEAALEEFQKSLKRAEEIDAVEIIIAVEEGLGSVYQAQGDYPAALKWFETAWSRAETIGDKVRMTEVVWREGQVFYSQGEYSKSTAAAQRAADLATRLSSPLLTYLALTLEGKAQRAQNSNGEAGDSFNKAIEAAEYMRGQIAGAEKEQQLFFENKISPYHEMVSLLIGQDQREDALSYAERAKARVLLDVLRNGRIIANKSLSQAERSDEQRLYSDMVSLNTQIRAERMNERPNDTRIHDLDGRLQQARSAYEAFQAALYARHPDLKAKRGLVPPFRLEDADTLLPDTRTAILEYVATEEQTYLFVLARSGESSAKVQISVASMRIRRTDLSIEVDRFRKLMSTNHPGFRQVGDRLYDLLVRPAEPYLKGKDTVCIVPDGPLWNLPFQALQNAEDKYLLELYAMYYAPSIQVLREMKKRSDGLQSSPAGKSDVNAGSLRRGAVSRLYAIGNPALSGEAIAQAQTLRNTAFAPLPETEQEVQALANEVYGPERSLVRIGAAAREDTIKAEIDKYSVLHFAAHGVLDDRNPLYSYIVLAPSSDSKEDGLLEAWEFMQMDLKAELVVLSACETARGRVGDGEGMIGMTWALLVAGVPTTVASQWQVPSQSTTRLMVGFHKNLTSLASGRKISKAEAWREAALGMIADPRYRMKPYYWAGFVVIGDGGW